MLELRIAQAYEAIMRKQRLSYALRPTSNGTYVVFAFARGKATRIKLEDVRYESPSLTRAERVLNAFVTGAI